ncbi:MAG: cytochrome c3 family protein [Wenzhouxiangella sp.]
MSSFPFKTLTIVAIAVVVAGVSFWQLGRGFAALSEPVDFRQVGYVGSAICADCHDDRHGSWYNTYHRTMTQEAGDHSVQGAFDGQPLDYLGWRVRPVREGARYFFEYIDPDSGALVERLQVHRTVGSNRYQQYLTRLPEDGTYVRLHYLWHNGDQRWVHMNGVFLGPDDRPFDAEVAIWNQNCIFCHNTGPQPRMTNYESLQARALAGEPVDVSQDARFESQVAELGISCETCHGPGERHVERARDGWQRLAMHLSAGRDTSIVNPVRLDAERSNHVCAQCHAARMPPDVDTLRAWMDTGPTFRPGDDLYDHVHPLTRETRAPIDGHEDLFKLRFWADGTPRLTAYEYQGQAMSACHQKAELSCNDCHSMHAGDPAGQITDRNRGNAPCLACHQEYRSRSRLAEHTRHDLNGPGSLCYNCHMPHLNYGVMTLHRSHRIENPDVHRDAAAGRPNACLNCHVEESVRWAAEALAAWPGVEPVNGALHRMDGGSLDISDAATMLMGDPVQKSIAAWRAGHPDNATRGEGRAWLVPYLLAAMQDNYPASRRFARASLLDIIDDWADPALAELRSEVEAFDFMADLPIRERSLARANAYWQGLDKGNWPPPPESSQLTSDYLLPEPLRQSLIELGRRLDKQISIGE